MPGPAEHAVGPGPAVEGVVAATRAVEESVEELVGTGAADQGVVAHAADQHVGGVVADHGVVAVAPGQRGGGCGGHPEDVVEVADVAADRVDAGRRAGGGVGVDPGAAGPCGDGGSGVIDRVVGARKRDHGLVGLPGGGGVGDRGGALADRGSEGGGWAQRSQSSHGKSSTEARKPRPRTSLTQLVPAAHSRSSAEEQPDTVRPRASYRIAFFRSLSVQQASIGGEVGTPGGLTRRAPRGKTARDGGRLRGR